MPRFLRVVVENWQLKLLAVALAVLLWVVVASEQVTSNWIPIPLVLDVTDPGFRVERAGVPRDVRVRFVGPGREFLDVAVRRPPLILRIDRVESPDQLFELRPTMVRLPDALDVTASDVEPGFLRLRFRRLLTVELPVSVEISGGIRSSATVFDSVRVTPRYVRVSGAAERIEELRQVRTIPIPLPLRDGRFDQLVPLDTTGLGGATLSRARVRVSGHFERVVVRRLAGVPISTGPGLNISPRRADVVLRGARSVVGPLRSVDFRLVLAIDSIPTQLPPEGLSIPLRAEGLPEGVAASGIVPASVLLVPGETMLDSIPAAVSPGEDATAEGGAAP